MLNELTKEQEELMDKVADEWLTRARTPQELNKKSVEEAVNWLYVLCDLPQPEVIIVKSPMAAQEKAIELTGEKKFHPFCSYGNYSDYGWLSFYDFFHRIGILKDDEDEVKAMLEFRKLQESGIYDMIQFDKVAIIVPKPKKLYLDENWNMTSTETMAIEWEDGYGEYYVHGVLFEKEMFEKVFVKKSENPFTLSNMEQRMAAIKGIGLENLLRESNAVLIHQSKKGNKLYYTDRVFDSRHYFLNYKDPSTDRVYVKWLEPKTDAPIDADEEQAKTFGLTKKEYLGIAAES